MSAQIFPPQAAGSNRWRAVSLLLAVALLAGCANVWSSPGPTVTIPPDALTVRENQTVPAGELEVLVEKISVSGARVTVTAPRQAAESADISVGHSAVLAGKSIKLLYTQVVVSGSKDSGAPASFVVLVLSS